MDGGGDLDALLQGPWLTPPGALPWRLTGGPVAAQSHRHRRRCPARHEIGQPCAHRPAGAGLLDDLLGLAEDLELQALLTASGCTCDAAAAGCPNVASGRSPHAAKPKQCQADGCTADLSACPAHMQRCHICSNHVHAERYTCGGVPTRFCQRCRQGHALSAFEATKHCCCRSLQRRKQLRREKQAARPAIDPPASMALPALLPLVEALPPHPEWCLVQWQALAAHAPQLLPAAVPAAASSAADAGELQVPAVKN